MSLYVDAGHGVYFRLKNVSRVLDELKYQISEYKADYIYFNSETFFARKEQELKLFATEYAEK